MIGGKPLFLHSFETWKQAADKVGNCRIFTVARSREILEEAVRQGFFPVESPDSEKGISYSVKAGIQAVMDRHPGSLSQADRLVFSVSDQPFLQEDTLIRFLTAVPNSSYAVFPFRTRRIIQCPFLQKQFQSCFCCREIREEKGC